MKRIYVTGRPPKYDDSEKMAKAIDKYFNECIENNEPFTVTGLALYLGFCSRVSLYDYEKIDQFSSLIKKARLIIENQYEKYLTNNEKTAGTIFWLKNHGWSDKLETENKTEISVKPPIFWEDETEDNETES
jgi:hypothetical protein